MRSTRSRDAQAAASCRYSGSALPNVNENESASASNCNAEPDSEMILRPRKRRRNNYVDFVCDDVGEASDANRSSDEQLSNKKRKGSRTSLRQQAGTLNGTATTLNTPRERNKGTTSRQQQLQPCYSTNNETSEVASQLSDFSVGQTSCEDLVLISSVNESTEEVEDEARDHLSEFEEEEEERSRKSNSVWDEKQDDDDDRVASEIHTRYELAKTLREAVKPSSQTLLEQLLDQSDKYTGFMLARSLAAGGTAAPAVSSFQESCASTSAEKETTCSPSPSSVSNRQARNLKRQKKDRDNGEEEMLMMEADQELTGMQKGFWTRLSQQPSSITGGTLKPYQLEGLNWLIHLYESGLNGILADEMGLGKTLQTISLMAFLKDSRRIPGPHLVLAPKSTLGNWSNEIKRFCPSLRAYRFHGNKLERQEAKNRGLLDPQNKHHDIFITSYELCIKEQAVFRKFNFRYIIVDEAHRIKNEASKLSKVIRTFKTQFRLLLTGTPLQNNLRELWSLLNFLFPEMFASSEEFDRMFDLTGNFEDSKGLSSEEKTARNATIVTRLHKILKPFLLRRAKADVAVELPPKKELLLYIPLCPMQRTLYKDLLAKNVEFLTDTGGRVRLLNLAMQLRKACNHPYLFEGYEDKTLDPYGDHLIKNCGKLILLDRLLQKLIATGSRTLIFTQMTRMIDILEDYCRMRGFSYCRLDGATSGEDRERQIEEFNAPDSPQSIFLLSTRAGGLGINLATADTVVIYDSDFNPQVDLQAMDRAHRIGQKKHVNVYRLVHEHTIEEKIIERAMLKLRLDSAVIQQGRLSDRQSQQLSKTDLMRLVQYGADQIYKSGTNDVTTLTDEDIDLILSRGEQKTEELSGKLKSHLQQKATNLLDFDFSSVANLYEFEGVDYNADRNAWAEIGVTAIEKERNSKRKVRVAQEQFEELQRQQHQMQLLAASSCSTGPYRSKGMKLPKMEDWQFFDRRRILELHERELEHLSVPTREFLVEKALKEKEEKQALLAQGFGDWSRKDFFNFVKSCETVGLENTEAIARDVGKTEEDVKRYLKVFMERYQELADGEKWFKRVKSGDDVNVKRQQMEQILERKLANVNEHSWRRLSFKFPKLKTQFSDDEDKWLLTATLTLGYGNWEQLQMAISADPLWMFNWFMRSRTPQDLGRRVEYLARRIQEEAQEETSTRSKAAALLASNTKKCCSDLMFYAPAEDILGRTIRKNVRSQQKELVEATTRSAGRKAAATKRKRKEEQVITAEERESICHEVKIEATISDKDLENQIECCDSGVTDSEAL